MILILTLIVAVLLGLGVTLFATQNASPVDLSLASYRLNDVPLYLIIILSLLVGLLIAWLISLINSVSSSITMFGKDIKINRANRTADDLARRVKELELENEKLKKTRKDIV